MMILDLFMFRDTPFRHACDSPRAPLWMAIFLIGTGIVYGVLLSLFQRAIGGEIQGVPLSEISNTILYAGNIVSGVLVSMVFHGGVTLLIWLMARAVGGPGRLGTLYRASSYILPLTFFALPYLAADSAAGAGAGSTFPLSFVYLPFALVSVAFVLPGLYHMVRVTQGLGPRRSVFAVALFVLFCVSILLVM